MNKVEMVMRSLLLIRASNEPFSPAGAEEFTDGISSEG